MRRPDLALNVAAHGAARRGVLERAPDVRCAARRRAVTFLKLRRHGGAVTLESRRAGLAAIQAKSRSHEASTDHGASTTTTGARQHLQLGAPELLHRAERVSVIL